MRKKLILFSLLAIMFYSCKDYLDAYPNGDRQEEDIWDYQDMVQGLVGQCYDNMSRNYDNSEGSYFDGATDDAVITRSTDYIRLLAVGALNVNQDPFQTYWDRDYRSIYLVNLFLKDRKGFKTRFLINTRLDSLVRFRLQGEAFAIRAWFQWDLLQRFGGKGVNGQLLGFPIIKEPLDPGGNINLARNTYDECAQQILDDCDSAYYYFTHGPLGASYIAHRDFLVPNTADKAYAGGRYWGRFDGITTRAIKALVCLTWASPRFNPSNDVNRWDMAAKFSKEVIDFKLNKDNVTNGFKPANQVNWFDPNFPGIIFSSRYNSNNDAMERMFYPGGFQGNGVIGATQELVNSFPMENGYPITDTRSLYDPTKPYLKRDRRFYSVIFYNTAQAIKINTTPAQVMYTFENWNGGKDAPGPSNNSRTNYHIKKFVYMGLNWSDNSITRQPHSKFFIRWAHMVLTFAEAANNVVGPLDAAKYGLSAKAAIQHLRTRKTYDGANLYTPTTDPYLDEVAAQGSVKFNELIKNERRIETCFEGLRFYDMRRWTTDLSSLNRAVHGAGIQKNTDGSFTYDLNLLVESRVFTSAYLPIPFQEMLRMRSLVQNEGWETWR